VSRKAPNVVSIPKLRGLGQVGSHVQPLIFENISHIWAWTIIKHKDQCYYKLKHMKITRDGTYTYSLRVGRILHLFLKSEKDLTPILVWPVPLAQVLPHPRQISPSKTWFFGNLFEFSAAEITLKSISPTFWIQILPNKFH